jgi:hypothetical protein
MDHESHPTERQSWKDRLVVSTTRDVLVAALLQAGCHSVDRQSPEAPDAGPIVDASFNDGASADGPAAERDGASASLFDLFHRVFSDALPPDGGEAYRLYYLGGPGGSRPVRVDCQRNGKDLEIRVNVATGRAGYPDTWHAGREWHRVLTESEAAHLRELAHAFVERVQTGAYSDVESEFLDGATVAAEVSSEGVGARVARTGPNDSSFLSPFEIELFTLAPRALDGGIPGIGMRISGTE